jgi:hypothetical protein
MCANQDALRLDEQDGEQCPGPSSSAHNRQLCRLPAAAIKRALRFTADSYQVALPVPRTDDGGHRDESQRRLVGQTFLFLSRRGACAAKNVARAILTAARATPRGGPRLPGGSSGRMQGPARPRPSHRRDARSPFSFIASLSLLAR